MANTVTIITIGVAALLLAGRVAAAETPAAPAPTPDRDQEMICKRVTETGSLVRAKKTCHTRAQWAYIADVNSRTARDLVEANTGRPTSN